MDLVTSAAKSSDKKSNFLFYGFLDLYIFALAIKVSVFAVVWHYGLVVGFWEYILSYGIMMVAYLILVCSLMEMISMVTFPGGYYGYARCALGSNLGYVVGCSAVLENIFFVSAAILRISQSITYAFQLPPSFIYIWWVLVYLTVIIIHAIHQNVFWSMMNIITVSSIMLYLIYLLGTSQYLDFDKYSNAHDAGDFLEGGFIDWFSNFRLPSIFFFGLDMIICVSDQVPDPRRNICKVMMAAFVTMVILSVWFIVTFSSQHPGLTKGAFNPTYPFSLGYGFSRLFAISLRESTIYAVLPLFSSVLSTIFIACKQINAIANSGFFPSIFKTNDGSNIPLNPQVSAMLATAMIGFVGNIVAWNYDQTVTLRLILLSGFVVYIGMLLCYIKFSQKYGSMERYFHSPFGVTGAVAAIIIFLFAFGSLLYAQTNNYAAYMYLSCMALLLIYYGICGVSNQVFSTSEQQFFFKMYVVNANIRRREIFHHHSNDGWRSWWTLFRATPSSNHRIHCDVEQPRESSSNKFTPVLVKEVTEVMDFESKPTLKPNKLKEGVGLQLLKPTQQRMDSEETVSISIHPTNRYSEMDTVLYDVEDTNETYRTR